jgi:hypothetical protein
MKSPVTRSLAVERPSRKKRIVESDEEEETLPREDTHILHAFCTLLTFLLAPSSPAISTVDDPAETSPPTKKANRRLTKGKAAEVEAVTAVPEEDAASSSEELVEDDGEEELELDEVVLDTKAAKKR